MGRHAAPDRWAFWRSFAKAVGGALLALLLTAALVLLLVDMGQARIVVLPGQRVAENVDPSPSPGPAPVPEAPQSEQGHASRSGEPSGQGQPLGPLEPDKPAEPAEPPEPGEATGPDEPADPDASAGPHEPDGEPGAAPRAPAGTDGWAAQNIQPGSGEVLPGDALSAAEVTVQVLDGAGNPAGTRAVAALLGDLGYDVVAIGQARRRPVTTVFWSEGFRVEAWELLAADERFSVVEENPNLTQSVDLHVVVGADWPQ